VKANARRRRLRDALAGAECFFPASVYDALSARIAQDAGFESAMLAGSTASLAVLGAPDLVLITLSEFAEQARRITRACDVPLIVDADHGYGNALNVMRTVEELENAGVAALTIEDTELPAPFGAKGSRLLSKEEGVGKIRAALAARDDQQLVIAGRTSAPAISGIDDAIERCLAYQHAGADAVFLSGLKNRADLEKFCARMSVPVLLGSVPGELRDRAYLAGLGVRIALQGHLPLQAAIQAVSDTMRRLRNGEPADNAIDPATIPTLSRAADHARWSEEYLNA